MFHPPGALHSGQVRKNGGRSFFIELDPTLFERIDEQLTLQNAPLAFHGGLPNRLVARLYREFRQTDSASEISIRSFGAGDVSAMLTKPRQVHKQKQTALRQRSLRYYS